MGAVRRSNSAAAASAAGCGSLAVTWRAVMAAPRARRHPRTDRSGLAPRRVGGVLRAAPWQHRKTPAAKSRQIPLFRLRRARSSATQRYLPRWNAALTGSVMAGGRGSEGYFDGESAAWPGGGADGRAVRVGDGGDEGPLSEARVACGRGDGKRGVDA